MKTARGLGVLDTFAGYKGSWEDRVRGSRRVVYSPSFFFIDPRDGRIVGSVLPAYPRARSG